MKCKDCKFFEQMEWHPIINNGVAGEKQLGGHCRVILSMLSMTNLKLFWMDYLHVQGSFGCNLGENVDD